ncbi:MAG TPA: dockerin type I domain-containing protein, partial [Thermoguttaceae bacterium]|nr:dockerin type I domain-containing protein [Thermoguttaceae bacterium]
TSYHRGINGIMVDVADAPGAITAGDFLFHVGNQTDPSNWAEAPTPQSVEVRPGAGVGGSDRVTIVWADHAIENQWLQVSVRADTLGLATDDVFYFGHALAESGNQPADAQVTTVDLLLARNNPRSFLNPAEVDFAYDYNRDGRVNSTDVLLARNNQTNFLSALRLIDLSAPAPAAVAQAPLPSALWDLSADQAAWLRQCAETDDAGTEDSEKPDTAAEAVDLLLATYWP